MCLSMYHTPGNGLLCFHFLVDEAGCFFARETAVTPVTLLYFSQSLPAAVQFLSFSRPVPVPTSDIECILLERSGTVYL